MCPDLLRRQFQVSQFSHALDFFHGYFGGHSLRFPISVLPFPSGLDLLCGR